MHRELEAMKEVATIERGEERMGLEGTNRLGTHSFFFFPDLFELILSFVLAKKNLMPPLPASLPAA